MTNNSAFEAQLRRQLAATRPTEGASTTLAARVRDIPERVRLTPPAIALLVRAAVPIAAVGLAAAALLIASFGFTRAPVVGLPPDSVGAAVVGFDPAIQGTGLIDDYVRSAALVGLAVVLLSGAVGVGTFLGPRAGTRRGRLMILGGVLGVFAGIGLIRFDVGLTVGGLRGAPLRYVEAPAPALGDTPILWFSTAATGEPTVGTFSLRNTSALPVRIEGLVGYSKDLGIRHWKALWIPVNGAGLDAPALDQIRPFEPVTLEPMQELNVYIAGIGSPCAFGPAFDPEAEYSAQDLEGYTQLGPGLQVVVSVFGLTSMETVDVGETFAEPIVPGCNGGTTLGG